VRRLFPTHQVGRNIKKSSIVRQATLVEAGSTAKINARCRIRFTHGLPSMSRNIPDRMRRLFLTNLPPSPFTTLPTRLLLPQTTLQQIWTLDDPVHIAPRQLHLHLSISNRHLVGILAFFTAPMMSRLIGRLLTKILNRYTRHIMSTPGLHQQLRAITPTRLS